jgi:hypothetical protein
MRRIWSARRGPVVFVSACLFALAGCGGSDPGPVAPTTMHPGTAVTPTTSTPTLTTDPSVAAIAAVEKLIREYNLMLSSGTTERFRATFTRSCGFCLEDANSLDRIFRAGKTISGGGLRVTHLRVALAQHSLAVVEGDQRDSPAIVRLRGKVVDRFAGGTTSHLTWRVESVQGVWLIADESPVK